MGDMTSTNEETLASIHRRLKPDEKIVLEATGDVVSGIAVYVIPKNQNSTEFLHSGESHKKDCWKCWLQVIEMHTEVWASYPNVASQYR